MSDERADENFWAAHLCQSNNVTVEYAVHGVGAPVLLLPGRGGYATDQYVDLAARLANAGYQAVAINPRGVGRSKGELAGLTLHDLAGNIARVSETLAAPVAVIGRALGNRVARCFASDYPNAVRCVCLIAAGGLVPPQPAERRGAPQFNFRYSRVAGNAHQQAADATLLADWWDGGSVPTLVIQGLDDHIAPPGNGHALRDAHPDRVTVVDIPSAGHQVLFEQPAIVADAIVDFLRHHY